MEKKYRKYVAIMILCFLFGGFSIILYLYQAYDIIHFEPIRRETRNLTFNTSERFERRGFFERPPDLFSPFSLTPLILGIISAVAGFSIWDLIREKEIKSAKKAILDVFLLPEEKQVIDIISKNSSPTQNEITKITGFSRVKVHRILKNLERKNLIQKQEYGMTNKIILKESS